MQGRELKRCILYALLAWIIYFAVPGPGQLYRRLVKFPPHPSYLYAGSEWQVCQRLRRVKEGKAVNLYIENLTHHSTHIILTQKQIRALIIFCTREGART